MQCLYGFLTMSFMLNVHQFMNDRSEKITSGNIVLYGDGKFFYKCIGVKTMIFQSDINQFSVPGYFNISASTEVAKSNADIRWLETPV